MTTPATIMPVTTTLVMIMLVMIMLVYVTLAMGMPPTSTQLAKKTKAHMSICRSRRSTILDWWCCP